METRKIIIDTDPGIDDAAAISVMLSEPSLDVKLIASVSGNVGIEHTTNNALKLLTFLKKDVPVAKGAAAPLLRDNRFATNAHGKSGMGGFEFPEPNQGAFVKRKCSSERISGADGVRREGNDPDAWSADQYRSADLDVS